MKSFTSRYVAAVALALFAALTTEAQQLVLNYTDESGIQNTKTANQFDIYHDGNNLLFGNVDVREINFIMRQRPDNANVGQLTLHKEVHISPQDLTIISDEGTSAIAADGSFNTKAGEAIAINKDHKIVYRSRITVENNSSQMYSANLDAMETAISMLMPFFDWGMGATSDYCLGGMKMLISQLPETKALAEAIDMSIITFGYLNADSDIVRSKLQAAYDALAEKSGMNEVISESSAAPKVLNQRAMNTRRSYSDQFLGKRTQNGIELDWLTYNNQTVDIEDGILNRSYQANGYRCTFNAYNKNRFAYSAVMTGRVVADGSVLPVSSDFFKQLKYMVAPQRVSGFLDTYRDWDQFKQFWKDSYNLVFTKGYGFDDMHYLDKKLENIVLDFSQPEDVVLIAGPRDTPSVAVYNIARIMLSVVVNDLLGKWAEDTDFDIITDFLGSMQDDDQVIQDIINIWGSNKDGKTKAKEYWNLLYPAFLDYLKDDVVLGKIKDFAIKQGASLVLDESLDLIIDNATYYVGLVESGGDKVLTCIGMLETNTFFTLEGLTWTTCPDQNHPHFVTLGLPSGTKWACCNLGASKPEEYGKYYAWGETQTKEVYNWSTYAHCDGSSSTIHDIGKDIAGTQYDAATVNWGSSWQMPSKEQCAELEENCTFVWTIENGVSGRKYTGPNGRTIFFPAAGLRSDGELIGIDSGGYYWSSGHDNEKEFAWLLYFYPDNDEYLDLVALCSVFCGLSIRPVGR